jgi:hypothetical protein
MSVAEILEARERAAAKVSFLPVENTGRRRVQDALDVIAGEIARLRLLQKHEDDRRRARAEVAAITAKSLAKVEARARDRDRMITIDRTFFQELGLLALKSVHAAQYVELQTELERLWALKE